MNKKVILSEEIQHFFIGILGIYDKSKIRHPKTFRGRSIK